MKVVEKNLMNIKRKVLIVKNLIWLIILREWEREKSNNYKEKSAGLPEFDLIDLLKRDSWTVLKAGKNKQVNTKRKVFLL